MIRELLDAWQQATADGDTEKVLGLMTEDVVFMVAGRAPFGKREFAASAAGSKGVRIESKSEIVELRVVGDFAWCRTRLDVQMTQENGEATRRSGYTLTILQKQTHGAWLLARDANLLTSA